MAREEGHARRSRACTPEFDPASSVTGSVGHLDPSTDARSGRPGAGGGCAAAQPGRKPGSAVGSGRRTRRCGRPSPSPPSSPTGSDGSIWQPPSPDPTLTRLADRAPPRACAMWCCWGWVAPAWHPRCSRKVIGSGPGMPSLLVLDSTHPGAVRSVLDAIDPARTWFLVSSKSGTTLETLSLLPLLLGRRVPGDRPNLDRSSWRSPTQARRCSAWRKNRGFAAAVPTPTDVGGRYSALTPFGLLPAALIGAEADRIRASAAAMADAAGPEVHAAENPALVLGAVIGVGALRRQGQTHIRGLARVGCFPRLAGAVGCGEHRQEAKGDRARSRGGSR